MNDRHLPLSNRTTLVTTDTACAVLGVGSEAISSMVDDGTLVWVWDVSSRHQHIRELRFLAHELINPANAAKTYPEIISNILPPSRERFRASEVAMTLRVSDPHIVKLIKCRALSGKVINHTRWISRASMAIFLQNRLLNSRATSKPLSRN